VSAFSLPQPASDRQMIEKERGRRRGEGRRGEERGGEERRGEELFLFSSVVHVQKVYMLFLVKKTCHSWIWINALAILYVTMVVLIKLFELN